MELKLAGPGGELLASYAVVVELTDWRLDTLGPSLYRLTGKVRRTVPALLSLRPLRARLRLASGSTWGWAVEAVEVAGQELVATLSGDPEPTRG